MALCGMCRTELDQDGYCVDPGCSLVGKTQPPDRVPYGAIRWLVNTSHVSTPDEVIAEDIITRLETEGATLEELDLAVAYALRVHEENYALYVAVNRGDLSGLDN